MNRLPLLAALAVLSVPLAAGAEQPLVSDDAGVLGKGHGQLELGMTRQPAGAQRTWETTLTYGLTDQTDVYVDTLYTNGGDSGSGWGDTELGLKWRLAQYGPVSLMLKPGLMLPTGDRQRGLGTGRTGAGATLVVQWESERFTLLGNARLIYQPNGQGQRQSLWQISGAALYHVTGQLQLAVDTVVARNPFPQSEKPPVFLIAGVIYSPQPWVELDIGYRHGLNGQADPHAVMAGLTVRW